VEFKTSSYRSGFIGLAVAGGLAVLAVGLSALIVSIGEVSVHRPLPLLVLGLGAALLLILVALALALYWSIAALRLYYHLDRNGLVIYWGASKLIVPIERIERITSGDKFITQGSESSGWRVFRGIGWSGLRTGQALLDDNTLARVYTTSPLVQSIVVLTPDHAYVVSPRDPDAFVEAWRVRRPLGPTQNWQEEERRAWFLNLPIWRDRVAWTLIGLGLLANLALHIYISLIYDRLPTMLSFHFDVLGQADRIASRIQILRLPQVALLVLVLDLGVGFVLYRRRHVAAYLIWGGGLALQLFVWGAVFTIIG
jgi:hypothetical protein